VGGGSGSGGDKGGEDGGRMDRESAGAGMSKETGGPAFPSESADGFIHTGMTLRDYFAAKALPAFLTDWNVPVHEAAERAYQVADLMLEERGEG
jgi:hypothetical protein